MTKALEFHANYELGASVPGSLCGGIVLPKTLQVIKAHRPMGADHFIAWETLTHAINP